MTGNWDCRSQRSFECGRPAVAGFDCASATAQRVDHREVFVRTSSPKIAGHEKRGGIPRLHSSCPPFFTGVGICEHG